jgi:triosephosphate isomerase
MSLSPKRPLVAGNWKMHLTVPEACKLVRGILDAGPELSDADLVLIPPFTALGESAKLLEGTAVGLGAQDLFWEEKGAFTGEISGPMLRDAGCAYVVVGHSERRKHFGETDSTVNRKTRAAVRSGLKPIVCVGESLEERESGKAAERVESQITEGLRDLGPEEISDVILAYEPVWAIGTGKNATPEQAQEIQAHLRGLLEERYGNPTAECAIILYGGSVKAANSYSLFKERDIDGFLVGGASLDAESFSDIAGEAIRAYREEK